MECSDQKYGHRSSNELVSHQLKVSINKCGCHTIGGAPIPSSKSYTVGSIQTRAGDIPQISTQLTWKDYLGAFKVRWGIRRNSYHVEPGLYAVGKPTEHSDVLVTANYKLTFDTVRNNLVGLNVWLLVLDTKGINVWCAAGKGTFGTEELVWRIQSTSLGNIVIHKRLILPQLGATGVAAHLVKESSGFTVIYGPVRASDIQSFIQSGYKASKEMRHVKFALYDRLKLVPNDIIYNLRCLFPMLIVVSLLSGISVKGYSIEQVLSSILPITIIILAGYFGGIFFTPLLLPYIPARSFSFKGFIVGGLISVVLFVNNSLGNSLLQSLAGFFFISGFSSFLAMLFTGSSTFTSLAGVKREMRVAVPVQIASGVLAFVFILVHNLIA